MKRVQRSVLSKNDGENEPPTKSPKKTVPVQTRRKAAMIAKENKENVSSKNNKNGRKKDVQQHQEKKSAVLREKNDKRSGSKSSVHTAVSQPFPSEPEKGSKKKIPTKLVDDVKLADENIVEPNPPVSTKVNQPKPAKTSRRTPVVVLTSITTRRKKRSNDTRSSENSASNAQSNREKSWSPVQKMTTRRGQKASETKTQKRQVVAKTSSDLNRTGISNAHGSPLIKQKSVAMKTSTKKTITTGSAMKDNKKSHASSVTTRRNFEKKQSSEPVTNLKTNVEQPTSTQFVTTRRNGNAPKSKSRVAKEDKAKIREPVISNVITRRRAIKANFDDSSEESKTVSDITRSRRSKSVNRAISEKEVDTNSNLKRVGVKAAPVKKSKPPKNTDQKMDPKTTKQSSNRSTASDSSDHSNVSTMPIYKRINKDSHNAEESVFDFESNSQENTLNNNDDQTNELIAKLVREKKATVIKHKRKDKEGTTKAKAKLNRSKQIEKIRCDLKELKEMKLLATKANVKNVPQTKTSRVKTVTNTMPDKASVVNLVDEEESKSKEQQSSEIKELVDVEQVEVEHVNVEHVNVDVEHVEENVNIEKTPNRKVAATPYATPTSPRKVQNTYAGPKKGNSLYQSTPVRSEPSGNASPWRLNFVSKYFSRFSEIEKPPIKGDTTAKTAAENNSPNKKEQEKPLATKRDVKTSHEIVKRTSSENYKEEIRNCFGFLSDDSEDNSDTNDDVAHTTHRPSLPAVINSFCSPKKPTTSAVSPQKTVKPVTLPKEPAQNIPSTKLPECPFATVFNYIRKGSMPLSKDAASKKPKSKQTKISTHYGNVPSSSKRCKIVKKKVETTRSKGTEVSTSYVDLERLNFFETKFPSSPRTYSSGAKPNPKRHVESKIIMTDNESEYGDTAVHKRQKRTKQKDDKFEQELKQFEEEKNSEFMDVENYEVIMERST